LAQKLYVFARAGHSQEPLSLFGHCEE
jgi:hypothetical protein